MRIIYREERDFLVRTIDKMPHFKKESIFVYFSYPTQP